MHVSSNSQRPSKAQDLSGACILVLDDDFNMRSLIRGALTRCGCENVLQTGSARDALRLFSTQTIDMVICDWSMEPMSGLEFLRELRRPERGLNVPVIMLTASSERRDMALAHPFKISGWLVKPIALPQLIERISAVLYPAAATVVLEKRDPAEVERLAEQYRARLINDLRDIDDALAAMRRADPVVNSSWNAAAERVSSWVLLDRLMHNIKGQAGTFGYGLITSVAALGQTLTRPISGNIKLVFHHHDEVHRCITALVQAMRLVMQNEIRGDGGQVGERLLEKLRSYTVQARAKFDITAGSS
jgi:two-component system chemotaxis response regulator CheY